MNHLDNTSNDTHHMGPNAQIWGLYRSDEVEKCAYYCGREATTENVTEFGTDKCCEQCLKEIIEFDKDCERAQEVARIQEEVINALNK